MRSWGARSALALVTAFALLGCGANTGAAGAPAPLLAYLDAVGTLRVVGAAAGSALPFEEGPALTAPFEWSPNGQLLVASDGVDLWVARPGGTPGRVTTLGAGERAVAAAWTLDGLRIAYQVEGETGRIDVVDRLTGVISTAHPYAATLAGWWDARGLASPFLAVHSESGEVLLVDLERRTQRSIATADRVVSVRGGAVHYLDDGELFEWTPFDGATSLGGEVLDVQVGGAGIVVVRSGGIAVVEDGAQREVASGSAPALGPASLLAFERGGEVMVLDLTSGEERSVGAGSAPAWQPRDAAIETPAITSPARNLLTTTTSFERGTDGWIATGFNAPAATVTREDACYGDAAAAVTFGGEQSVFATDLGGSRSAIHEREVTFSAWVRTSEPGVHLRYLASNAEPAGGVASEAHPGDGRWHRLTVTFTPRFDVGGTTSYAILGLRASGSGNALVDGVQLEYGDRATEYEPARDDPLSALPPGQPIPPR